MQVNVAGGPGYVVKQPRALDTPDSRTVWVEAAVSWLSANDAAFAPLARWMLRYHHYHEQSSLLTTERIAPSESL